MTVETEAVTYYRSDPALMALCPGEIYANNNLTDAGITDAESTPDVWAGSEFQTCIVVRQRARVPTGALQSIQSQHTSVSQAIEVWAYAKTADEVEAVLNRIYALTMGHKFSGAFRAVQAGSMEIGDAPNLLGVKVAHDDYRMVGIRRAIAV